MPESTRLEGLLGVDINAVMDSINDGIYVCKPDRTIIFWSKSAERITGWRSEEVVGRRCKDGVLNHVDKDGHPLCGEEFCPLYRSMTTGKKSDRPLIVYAQGKDGRRIPTQVNVAPLYDDKGEVIGGVGIVPRCLGSDR